MTWLVSCLLGASSLGPVCLHGSAPTTSVLAPLLESRLGATVFVDRDAADPDCLHVSLSPCSDDAACLEVLVGPADAPHLAERWYPPAATSDGMSSRSLAVWLSSVLAESPGIEWRWPTAASAPMPEPPAPPPLLGEVAAGPTTELGVGIGTISGWNLERRVTSLDAQATRLWSSGLLAQARLSYALPRPVMSKPVEVQAKGGTALGLVGLSLPLGPVELRPAAGVAASFLHLVVESGPDADRLTPGLALDLRAVVPVEQVALAVGVGLLGWARRQELRHDGGSTVAAPFVQAQASVAVGLRLP